MGTALITYKIMPEGIPKNFDSLKNKLKEVIEKFEGKVNKLEEQPIAFGLKAVILTISLDETKETSPLEEELRNIDEVSSIDVIDYRRAIE
jgi:elongation factor 1-beta